MAAVTPGHHRGGPGARVRCAGGDSTPEGLAGPEIQSGAPLS